MRRKVELRVSLVAMTLVLGTACLVLVKPALRAAGFDPALLLRDDG